MRAELGGKLGIRGTDGQMDREGGEGLALRERAADELWGGTRVCVNGLTSGGLQGDQVGTQETQAGLFVPVSSQPGRGPQFP